MKKVDFYRLNKKVAISLALLCVLLSSCEFAQTVTASGPCDSFGICAGSSGGRNPPGLPSSESPFSLKLKSFWENDGGKTRPTLHVAYRIKTDRDGNLENTGTLDDLSTEPCQVPPGTQLEESDADDRNITCGVAIPETQLFFSSLDLEISAGKDSPCDVIFYAPYGYRASYSDTFISNWQQTAIDCSGNNPPAQCFNGPMIDTPEFPKRRGFYLPIFDKTQVFSNTFSVPAANTKERIDNRWVSYRRVTEEQWLEGFLGQVPFKDFKDELDCDAPQNERESRFCSNNELRNWTWTCTQKGSSLNFSIVLRIMPQKDSPFFPGAPRFLGWLDENEPEDRPVFVGN